MLVDLVGVRPEQAVGGTLDLGVRRLGLLGGLGLLGRLGLRGARRAGGGDVGRGRRVGGGVVGCVVTAGGQAGREPEGDDGEGRPAERPGSYRYLIMPVRLPG